METFGRKRVRVGKPCHSGGRGDDHGGTEEEERENPLSTKGAAQLSLG